MRRGLLIANPSASGFTGAGFRRVLEILGSSFAVDVAWPQDPADTRVRAREAATAGYDVVFAMGGDGVAHHVANGLANTSTALGIIPAGTTNVLARILGLPAKSHRAAEQMATLQPVATRMAHVVADTPAGPRSAYATFAVGVGFDAAVVEMAEQRPHSKISLGGLHYATTAIGRLLGDWRSRSANLRVDCNGDRKDAVAVLVQVHRPYTYFGRVPLDLSDRATSGMVAGAVSDLEVHRATEILMRAVMRRRFPERLGMRIWHDVQKLIVEAEPAAPFQADGELLGSTTAVEIAPAENALLVLRDPRSGQA
jgi:diacylglycerol kinase family enzyme